MFLPRFIRFRDAPSYLGMDRDRFNTEVRPRLTEIPIGTQGIAFDRLDLDAWADEYKQCKGRPGAHTQENEQWEKGKPPGFLSVAKCGMSTNASPDTVGFAAALAQATSKKRSAG